MRFTITLLSVILAGSASAQPGARLRNAGEAPVNSASHPSWWTYASPDATALVGIQWQYLRNSPMAAAVAGELAPGGSLGFPDLPILLDAQQILISSPELIAIEYGSFPQARLRQQATSKGLKRSFHEGVELWVTSQEDRLSVARVNDSVVLLAKLQTLKDTLTRMAEERGPDGKPVRSAAVTRRYSPLLARGAKFSDQDLWSVSTQLPDPLASRFIPIEEFATGFEGSVGLFEGMHVLASLDTSSVREAFDLRDRLIDRLKKIPELYKGTEITAGDRNVVLRIDLNDQQFAELLRPSQPSSPAGPPTAAQSGTAAGTVQNVSAPKPTEPVRTIEPAKAAAPPQPIKILGLDGGTREIPVPKASSTKH